MEREKQDQDTYTGRQRKAGSIGLEQMNVELRYVEVTDDADDASSAPCCEPGKLMAGVAVVIAILSVSAGGPLFRLLPDETPSFMKAAWRLQLATVFHIPFFIYYMVNATPEVRAAWFRHLPLLSVAGAALAIHFAAWVYGLDRTTLVHALLLVSCHPIVIVALAWGASIAVLLSCGACGVWPVASTFGQTERLWPWVPSLYLKRVAELRACAAVDRGTHSKFLAATSTRTTTGARLRVLVAPRTGSARHGISSAAVVRGKGPRIEELIRSGALLPLDVPVAGVSSSGGRGPDRYYGLAGTGAGRNGPTRGREQEHYGSHDSFDWARGGRLRGWLEADVALRLGLLPEQSGAAALRTGFGGVTSDSGVTSDGAREVLVRRSLRMSLASLHRELTRNKNASGQGRASRSRQDPASAGLGVSGDSESSGNRTPGSGIALVPQRMRGAVAVPVVAVSGSGGVQVVADLEAGNNGSVTSDVPEGYPGRLGIRARHRGHGAGGASARDVGRSGAGTPGGPAHSVQGVALELASRHSSQPDNSLPDMDMPAKDEAPHGGDRGSPLKRLGDKDKVAKAAHETTVRVQDARGGPPPPGELVAWLRGASRGPAEPPSAGSTGSDSEFGCSALPCAEGSAGGKPMPSTSALGCCGSGERSLEGGPPVPPTCLETIGAIIGFGSAAVVVLVVSAGGSTDDGDTPSAQGDIASFLGAAMAAVFLLIGRRVRRWMPLFLYATSINLIGAVVASGITLALDDGATVGGTEPTSLFGYFGNTNSLMIVALLAIGPSLLGHTCFYCSLSHLEPLVVSVVLLLEPVLGSIIGWALGEQGAPDAITATGGIGILAGAFFVTLGGRGAGGMCGAPALAWVDIELPVPTSDWYSHRDTDVVEAYAWERAGPDDIGSNPNQLRNEPRQAHGAAAPSVDAHHVGLGGGSASSGAATGAGMGGLSSTSTLSRLHTHSSHPRGLDGEQAETRVRQASVTRRPGPRAEAGTGTGTGTGAGTGGKGGDEEGRSGTHYSEEPADGVNSSEGSATVPGFASSGLPGREAPAAAWASFRRLQPAGDGQTGSSYGGQTSSGNSNRLVSSNRRDGVQDVQPQKAGPVPAGWDGSDEVVPVATPVVRRKARRASPAEGAGAAQGRGGEDDERPGLEFVQDEESEPPGLAGRREVDGEI